MREDQKHLEKTINYKFKNSLLLTRALTHRSHSENNNERFEFLGDALLNFIIGEELFTKFSTTDEGQLTRLRSSLVKKETLVEIANKFKINKYILLGEGELRSGGLQRGSILADCVEAIIAAIYLDSDFIVCKQCVSSWFFDLIQNLNPESFNKDAKTILQEWLQSKHYDLPSYIVISESGLPHNKEFKVKCSIKSLNLLTEAVGKNIRQAEQEAAKLIMQKILESK